MATATSGQSQLLADIFRRESGRIVGSLTRWAGPARLDLVEDALQDALLAAMRAWPISGTPANPAAWLHRASRNALIDRWRRTRREIDDEPSLIDQIPVDEAHSNGADAARDDGVFDDDLLRLLTYCCQPQLAQGAQVALTLRLACGLSIEEIAIALFAKPEAIAQRIVRAKRELRDAAVVFELPESGEFVSHRLSGIQQTIYLLFDAGYMSTSAAEPIRLTLVADALRLINLLLAFPPARVPTTYALAALLHLTAARLPARRGADGALINLHEQDRSLWDARLIARGFEWLDRSLTGEQLSRYHIEAAIAATHAQARDFAATDWPAILRHYDALMKAYPSPVVAVSRAIAVRYAEGPIHAWQAFQALSADSGFENSVLYRAARAELLHALGDVEPARAELSAAIATAGNAHVKALLSQRRDQWSAGNDELNPR